MTNCLLRANLEKVEVIFNGDPQETRQRDEFEKEQEQRGKRVEVLRSRLQGLGSAGNEKKAARLRRRIEKLQAHEEAPRPEIDNALVATLDYPRSGTSKISCFRALRLAPGVPAPDLGDPGEFLDSGLFKEEVQGETVLRIRITDMDRKNPTLQFLRKLLRGAFSAVTGDFLRGISNVVVSGAAAEVRGYLVRGVAGSSDMEETVTVAESEEVRIKIGPGPTVEVLNAGTDEDADVRFKDGKLYLKLESPRDFTTTRYRHPAKRGRGGGGPEVVDELILGEGEPNGEVVLRLKAEAI